MDGWRVGWMDDGRMFDVWRVAWMDDGWMMESCIDG